MTTYVEFTPSSMLPVLAEALHEREITRSRAGDTREILGARLEIRNPKYREILLPDRKASIVAQIAETMWVLAGRNDVEWLKRYLPRAPEFSDDGETWRAGYGPRIRNWGGVDQLAEVIRILSADPSSRRAVMSIFDPATDFTPDSKDIPCNNWLSFIIRDGRLTLMVSTRSNDLIWGWSGINTFEWSTIQEIVADILDVEIGSIIYNIASLHSYTHHDTRLQKIRGHLGFKDVVEPLPQEHFRIPYAVDQNIEGLDWLINRWMEIEEMIRNHDRSAYDALQDFPEPMLRSWLGVIYAYWNGDTSLIPEGGRLEAAYRLTPDSLKVAKPDPVPAFPENSFDAYVDSLHREKSAVYKGSWCKRGELLGIMANLARKADRLGVAGGGDSSADTVIDFFVYLVLYKLWLMDHGNGKVANGVTLPAASLENVADNFSRVLYATHEPANCRVVAESLVNQYEILETAVLKDNDPNRWELVDAMIPDAYYLARQTWLKEQREKKQWGGYGDED